MSHAPLLAVHNLVVDFDVDGQTVSAVRGVDLDVGPDEVVAIVGESGSGKSVTATSVLGLLPENARVRGSIRFEDAELLERVPGRRRRTLVESVRGNGIAMIFQDPISALDPVFTIGHQLVEAIRARRPMRRSEARKRAVELLRQVEMPDPESRLAYYPHQLSGGQAQRAVIAIALAGDPRLLIADEPTTALDVTVQAEVLDVLRRLRQRTASSILLITHDMGVVADLADRVVVMRDGVVVETNDAITLFRAPEHEYTRSLLDAVPRIGTRATERPSEPESAQATPALQLRELRVEYGTRLRGRFLAVDGVSLTIKPGETIGLVGESGSGKSTIGRCAVGLAPITSGSITVAGVDVATAPRPVRAQMRRKVGVVFQNPSGSLNPRYTVAETVAEPVRVHAGLRGSALDDRVEDLLAGVGLGGGRWRDRYPHELSGGQKQRVAIARAVSLDPTLLIADEPTSALDVSVQARVLDLIRRLQEDLGFACLFISHDLAVVDVLCDRVAVLNRGRLVESGTRHEVLNTPRDEYTRRLIASAPIPDPLEQRAKREVLSAAPA